MFIIIYLNTKTNTDGQDSNGIQMDVQKMLCLSEKCFLPSSEQGPKNSEMSIKFFICETV